MDETEATQATLMVRQTSRLTRGEKVKMKEGKERKNGGVKS